MSNLLKVLLKQPYWILALIIGAAFVALPCIDISKDHAMTTHQPSTLWPIIVGVGLLLVSVAGFGYTLVSKRPTSSDNLGAGLDLDRVRESNGVLWTNVSGCQIRVVEGRIESYTDEPGTTMVLPCNEYFDDHCINDTRSALGAYVNRAFEGRVEAFSSLVTSECRSNLGPGTPRQKTDHEQAESFGPGKCVLLKKPLGRSSPVALVSTTTQRAGQGLAARISYLFDGMRELVAHLADSRLNEVAMPVLGAGHGRIDPPLALVGLLLAVAEAARYGQGGQRLRKATIIVFKQDEASPPEVDPVVVRRALALIGSRD